MDLTWVARRPCYVYADSVFLVVLGIQTDLQDLATRDTYYTQHERTMEKQKEKCEGTGKNESYRSALGIEFDQSIATFRPKALRVYALEP